MEMVHSLVCNVNIKISNIFVYYLQVFVIHRLLKALNCNYVHAKFGL